MNQLSASTQLIVTPAKDDSPGILGSRSFSGNTQFMSPSIETNPSGAKPSNLATSTVPIGTDFHKNLQLGSSVKKFDTLTESKNSTLNTQNLMQSALVPPPSGVSSARGQLSSKQQRRNQFSFGELRPGDSKIRHGEDGLDFVNKIRFVNYLQQVTNCYHQFELMKTFLVSADEVRSIYKRMKLMDIRNLEDLADFLTS